MVELNVTYYGIIKALLIVVRNSSLNVTAESSPLPGTTAGNKENKTELGKEETDVNGHIDLVKTEIIINTRTPTEDAEMNICRV